MNPPYQDYHHHHFQNTNNTNTTGGYTTTTFDHPDNYYPPPPPPPDTSSNHLLSQYYYQSHSNSHGTTGCGGLSPTAMENMREMIFRMAAMQPILDEVNLEALRPKQRKNVKISTDPQSVAARRRRERISEKIRILQRMVPGGTKMDTASMLDEAARYVEFLKREIKYLEDAAAAVGGAGAGAGQVMWASPAATGAGGNGSYYNYNYASGGSGYENNSSSCSSTANLEDVDGFTTASSSY